MTVAEIVAIGTELLLGELQDTNSQYLARQFRLIGVDLHHVSIVGDNCDRISAAVNLAMSRADIVLTCGGLGPTVDDPTRKAIALAAGVELIFRSDYWDKIKDRFARANRKAGENNRRQAYFPVGAVPIDNPVGTAPAFLVEKLDSTVICLPGVPHEMKYLFEHYVKEYLIHRFDLKSFIKILVLHTSGVGESYIDELIGDFEIQSNPTIGLAAHSGQIDIRITAKADSEKSAQIMLLDQEKIIRERLGNAIYGKDEDTLSSLISKSLGEKHLALSLLESNLQSRLSTALEKLGLIIRKLETNPNGDSAQDLLKTLIKQKNYANDLLLAVSHKVDPDRQILTMVIVYGSKEVIEERFYGDRNTDAIQWIVNIVLDFLRRNIN